LIAVGLLACMYFTPASSPGAVPGLKSAGASSGFFTKVAGAAAQGAVAAVVAAMLSAFSEPIVNRLLVERCSISQAIAAVKISDCLKFFLTTFPTNMLKFPVFEVINVALSFTTIPDSVRGVVNGAVFCTIMLPVTNLFPQEHGFADRAETSVSGVPTDPSP